jgi:hypothetical protein
MWKATFWQWALYQFVVFNSASQHFLFSDFPAFTSRMISCNMALTSSYVRRAKNFRSVIFLGRLGISTACICGNINCMYLYKLILILSCQFGRSNTFSAMNRQSPFQWLTCFSWLKAMWRRTVVKFYKPASEIWIASSFQKPTRIFC